MIGITADGIVCGRLGRRLPQAERWDQTGWKDLRGVPWDLRPRSMLRLSQRQPRQSEETECGRDPGKEQNHSNRETQRPEEERKRKEQQQQHQHQRQMRQRRSHQSTECEVSYSKCKLDERLAWQATLEQSGYHYNAEERCRGGVHGDDFVVVGSRRALDQMGQTLHGKYSMRESYRLGFGNHCERHAEFVNRNFVSWDRFRWLEVCQN